MKKTIYLLIVMIFLSTSLVSALENDNAYVTTTFLNQDPDPAEQGEYLDLRWTVYKEGNDNIENLTFYLELDYPFFFDGSDNPKKIITNWKGDANNHEEYYVLHYKVRVDEDALEDNYEVTLRKNLKGYSTSEEFDIRVGDKEIPEFIVGDIESSPLKLTADLEESELSVTLENIGDGNADNVIIELVLPDGINPSYSYSTREVLGSLDAGDNNVAEFYIDTSENLIGGNYNSQLKISYKEENDEENEYKEIFLPLNIEIYDNAMFEIINIKTNEGSLNLGDHVIATLTIKNVGGREAESVSIKAYKESSQPFDFEEKSDFIGKLGPGEEGQAVIIFDIEEDGIPKKYLMDLEIRSIIGDDVDTDEKTISIEVKGKETNKFKNILIVSGIVLILSGAIGYSLKKKGKK